MRKKAATFEDLLLPIVRRLEATGKTGFEGLIAESMRALSGRDFLLARSGDQDGHDIASTGRTVVDIECKKYDEDTSLRESELLGALVKSDQAPRPVDLWILAATRGVSAQLFGRLTALAAELDVGFLALHTGGGSPSRLAALLAADAQRTIAFLHAHARAQPNETKSLQIAAKRTAADAAYLSQIAALRNELSEGMAGFSGWAATSRENCARVLQSRKESERWLGQRVDLLSHPLPVVRSGPREALSSWWAKGAGRPVAVLAEEGFGKTWLTLGWVLDQLTTALSNVGVVVLSSANVKSDDPLDLLVAAQLRVQTPSDERRWKNRFDRWLQEAEGGTVLLVLDGINERRRPDWWKKLLAFCSHTPRLRILVTAREGYWDDHFRGLADLPFATISVGELTDAELKTALHVRERHLNEFPESLWKWLKRPRYLDLAIRLSASLADGEVTPARMYYEDWKDRYQRKHGPISPGDFESLLKALASNQKKVLARPDVFNTLATFGQDAYELLAELETGGVFESKAGGIQLNEPRLRLGQALLLCEELEGVSDAETGGETIASWLDPELSGDERGQILESACLHALSSPVFPLESCVALLEAWVNTVNSPNRDETFVGYAPLRPEAYFALAEHAWKQEDSHSDLERLVRTALVEIITRRQVDDLVSRYLERWLGFVHADGYRAWHPSAAPPKESVADRVGGLPESGAFVVGGVPLVVIRERGLLRLGVVALGLMSTRRDRAFLGAVVAACVAEVAMRFPRLDKELTWVLRSNPAYEADKLRVAFSKLLVQESRVCQLAARDLAVLAGDHGAMAQSQHLAWKPPAGHFSLDPCQCQFPWARRDCEECAKSAAQDPYIVIRKLRRAWPDPKFVTPPWLAAQVPTLMDQFSRGQLWNSQSFSAGAEEHRFEELEPALCRTQPDALAPLVRDMARGILDLADGFLRNRYFGIRGHELTFGPAEWEALAQRSAHLSQATPVNRTEAYVESHLFALLLQGLSEREQLAALLNRHAEREDSTSCEDVFREITNWDAVDAGLAGDEAHHLYRVLWFASSRDTPAPERTLKRAAVLIAHPSKLVRACAIRLLVRNGDSRTRRALFESEWKTERDQTLIEQNWGSMGLVDAARATDDIEQLSSRLAPEYLGDLVRARGCTEPDLDFLIQRIDKGLGLERARLQWASPPTIALGGPGEPVHVVEASSGSKSTRPKKGTLKDLAERLDPVMSAARHQAAVDELNAAGEAIAELRSKGATELLAGPPAEVLRAISNHRPSAIERWLAVALATGRASDRLLEWYSGFYQDLCAHLLSAQPKHGVALYRRLRAAQIVRIVDGAVGVMHIDIAVWRAPAEPSVRVLRQSLLAAASSDKELFEISLAAAKAGASGALVELIRDDLRTADNFAMARSATLLGFCPSSPEVDRALGEISDGHPVGWVADVVGRARRRYHYDASARHWFDQFLVVDGEVEAWAAFRLLLKCVDRRFWTWVDGPRLRSAEPRRVTFYAANRDQIERACKENEKDLEKYFVGHDVLRGSMHPWL